jgi:hypothetical protein
VNHIVFNIVFNSIVRYVLGWVMQMVCAMATREAVTKTLIFDTALWLAYNRLSSIDQLFRPR